MKVVGFTGPMGSGKGELINWLRSESISPSFVYLSLSQKVREEASRRGIDYSKKGGRKKLQDVGNDMREKEGQGVLGKRATEKIGDLNTYGLERFVVDGIRNSVEIDELRELGEDTINIIGIDAPSPIRHKRILDRDRGSDSKTLEQIASDDARDIKIGIYECLAKSDFVIYNFNKTISDLHNELEEIIYSKGILDRPIVRPDWDDYYLNIADAVGRRGTCIRRRFGAVVVSKYNEIISTGFVGAPRGAPNCIDLGVCYREKLNIPSGQRYELCRSVHAEANAIIPASRRDMMGGTLYVSGRDLKALNHPVIKAHPCTYCQRQIMNSGVDSVITRDSESKIYTYHVKDWVSESKKDPAAFLEDAQYDKVIKG